MNFIMYTQRRATSKNEKIRKRRDDDQMMCFKIAIANWPSASSRVLRKYHSTQDILGPFRPRLWTCALRLWSQHHFEMHVCFFHGFNSLQLRLSNCHTSRCMQIYCILLSISGRWPPWPCQSRNFQVKKPALRCRTQCHRMISTP